MFELNWEGKDAAKNLVAQTPLKILKLDEESSCGEKIPEI